MRIGIAFRLLAETDKQITQVRNECGYNNLANLTTYIKVVMKKNALRVPKYVSAIDDFIG